MSNKLINDCAEEIRCKNRLQVNIKKKSLQKHRVIGIRHALKSLREQGLISDDIVPL